MQLQGGSLQYQSDRVNFMEVSAPIFFAALVIFSPISMKKEEGERKTSFGRIQRDLNLTPAYSR